MEEKTELREIQELLSSPECKAMLKLLHQKEMQINLDWVFTLQVEDMVISLKGKAEKYLEETKDEKGFLVLMDRTRLIIELKEKYNLYFHSSVKNHVEKLKTDILNLKLMKKNILLQEENELLIKKIQKISR